MNEIELGQRLLGKYGNGTEEQAEASAPATASVVYMVAVTSSSGGEVVVMEEDPESAWEEGADFVELDEEHDYDEGAFDDADEAESSGDLVIDLTDGDGADIEGEETESYTVASYHAESTAAFAAEAASEEEQEDDPLAGEDDEVSGEMDDGDASEVEDPGDPSQDDALAGEEETSDLGDYDFAPVDDNDDDLSDDYAEGAEASDGCTTVDTLVSVNAGDRVAVAIQPDGTPVVIGVVGGGDQQKAESEILEEAVDSILQLKITTDRPTVFEFSDGTATATASVYRRGEKLTDEEVAELGVIVWYLNGVAVHEGTTYTVKAGNALLTAKLEADE